MKKIISLIVLSFGIAVTPFTFLIMDLLEILGINVPNDYEFYIIFVIIVALFFTTYFISRKLIKGERQ